MINNELKEYNRLLLLAHSDILPPNQNSQKHGHIIICPFQKVLPLYIG